MAIELYSHNAYAYSQVESRLKSSNRTCVIHPTGSGKSFIAIKWLYENRDKKCLFLTSQKPIINQIIHHIENCGLTLDDFPNLEFNLYQNISEDYAKEISTDCVVLDEFHRCGAPEWGKGLDVLLQKNKNAKVLGFSATPIRYLDDCRNMAEELFDNNIASQISLVEAVAKGILPLPTYINALYSFDEDIERIQNKINKLAHDNDKRMFQEKFDSAKRLLEKSEGLEKVFTKHIKKKNGKFIIFCRDIEHMNRMIEESKDWFNSVNSNVDVYNVNSNNSDLMNRQVISSFESSKNENLKLLFCVNMLNEGLHVEDIDGVIMLRPTVSPIIYMQQLGRALSVGHNEHPIVFDIVNNSSGIKDINRFYEQLKNQIKSGTTNPAISGYKDIDIEAFELIDEMSSMIDLFEIIDNSLCKEVYNNSKAKKLFEDLKMLGHQPDRKISKHEASLYTALYVHGGEWLSDEQLIELSKFGIFIPRNLTEEELSFVLFEELKELGHQPSQAVPEESNLYSRLVQRGERYLSKEQLEELSKIGIYIPKEKTKEERANELFQQLMDFGKQPARTSESNEERNLYGKLQKHGAEWLSAEQLEVLSKKGISLPKVKNNEQESEEFFQQLMDLGHQPKKSNPDETSIYRKLQRRGSDLLSDEQLDLLREKGIVVPIKLEQSDYVLQTFAGVINFGGYPKHDENPALYQSIYKWKDKFCEEQLSILSMLGIEESKSEVEIDKIEQYLLSQVKNAKRKNLIEVFNVLNLVIDKLGFTPEESNHNENTKNQLK